VEMVATWSVPKIMHEGLVEVLDRDGLGLAPGVTGDGDGQQILQGSQRAVS
jgi:hypothetical protein